MASKKYNNKYNTQKDPRVGNAIKHGVIGAVPGGNIYEGYKAGRVASGGSRMAGVGGAVLANLTYPMGGSVAAGAYHGYHIKVKNGHHSVRKAPAGGHNHTKAAR